jgi:tetratricopeptide (TPR) repeat protein
MGARYGPTLRLLTDLPARRPAPTLPSRLDELFEKLAACPDLPAAERLEDAIWSAWMHHGHEEVEAALERAATDIAAGRFDIAETRLAILVRRRPDWAEAWNKQATLHYLRGRDDETVAAIHRTLELEPRHFGALAAFGEVLRAQGALEPARLAFGCALRLYPLHAGVRRSVQELPRAA